jgi:hypothetical protein
LTYNSMIDYLFQKFLTAKSKKSKKGRDREEKEGKTTEEKGLSEILCKWHLIFRTEPVHCQIK